MRALAITLALAATTASAICYAAEPWTLERCIDYAIEHNINVRQRALSADEGRLAVTEAQDRLLPTISGYASQNFNLGRALTSDNTYANRNTASTAFGAQLSLPLFQGLRVARSIEYSKTALKGLLEQVEAAKDDVTLNVISAYLQALYARELEVVYARQVEISTSELERRKVLLEAGKIPELDIYEATSQLRQDELNAVTAAGDTRLALLDLSQLLNLPADEPFDIAALDGDALPLLDPEEVYRRALVSNHAVRASVFDTEAADRNISVARAGYIPSLSFNAGLGTNYYRTTGVDNPTFSSQMRHNFAQSFGFSLSVPIFDGLQTRNAVRRATAQRTSAQLALDDTRARLYKSINQAYTQAVAAAERHSTAIAATEAAAAAFDAMEIKYNNGRATSTEYVTAKATYASAEARQLQAKYEMLLRARILDFYNK